jgi:SprB repeat/Secretion system C-terminal sorting domain
MYNFSKKIVFRFFILIGFSTIFQTTTAQVKILFDAIKAETAANADWIIDADTYNVGFGTGVPTIGGSGTEANPQRFPTPLQNTVTASTSESYWKGGLSSWGIECVKKGYQVETLPIGGKITYNDPTNVQDLSNYKVFIVCEPNILFTASEKAALLAFVQNGGGLFMISDHDNSDRNFDGYDSVAIWNDWMTGASNPFGISFDIDDFSQTSSNLSTTAAPMLNGSFGAVTKVQFSGGTSLTLNTTANGSVKGIVYKTGFSNTGNTGAMVATATYGAGKVAAMGDSSPADDGTGDPNDVLYDGWIADAGGTGNHRKLLMNITEWLASASVTPISASISTKKDVSCFGGNDGSATVTATGGTTPYSYLWSNGATTATAQNLYTGTYSVTVTGTVTAVVSVTIGSPSSQLKTTLNNANINCTNPSVVLSANTSGGTPNYTYKWTTTSTNNPITITQGGVYSVTATDSKGCSASATTLISEDLTAPNAVIAPINPLSCANNYSITFNTTGTSVGNNLIYKWSGPNSYTSTLVTPPSVSQPGSYNLTVTNTVNGCSKTANINVASSKPLIVQLDNLISANVGQNNGSASILVQGTAPFTYEWKDNANKIVGTSNILTNVSAGVYICKVMDSAGCVQAFTVVIPNTVIVTLSVIAKKEVSCFGGNDGSATVSATGGTSPFTYLWSNGATTATAQNLIAGTYTVTVTGAATATTSVTIGSPSKLSTALSNASLTCTNPSVILSANTSGGTPNYTYQWANNTSTTNQITVSSIGTYTVTTTDKNGCSSVATVSVTENLVTPIAAIAPISPLSCANNYSITFNTTGTSVGNNFTYKWSGPSSYSSTLLTPPSVSQSGTYSLTVTNSTNGCFKALSITVPTSTPLTVQLDKTTNASNGQSNGSASVLVQGTAPFTYEWKDNANKIVGTSNKLTNAAAGVYICKVMDSAGCVQNFTVIVQNTTAINQLSIEKNILVFPNPANDVVSLEMPFGESKVKVSNTQGMTMFEKMIMEKNTTIDVRNFPNGIYYFFIKNNKEGFEKTIRVIVLHSGM